MEGEGGMTTKKLICNKHSKDYKIEVKKRGERRKYILCKDVLHGPSILKLPNYLI